MVFAFRPNTQVPTIAFQKPAQPKLQSRQSQFPNFKQMFSGVAVCPQVSPITKSRTVQNTLSVNVTNQIIQNPITSVQTQPSDVLNDFIVDQKYSDPNKVILFGVDDTSGTLKEIKENQTKPHLFGEAIYLRLNPATEVNNDLFITVRQAIAQGLITLEIKGLVDIFVGKILNKRHHHLRPLVLCFMAINFENYPAVNGGVKSVFGWVTTILQDKMEKIRKLYALLYLGLALSMLINDKPVKISKREYQVQNFLREQDVVFDELPDSNNYSYSLIYERPINLPAAIPNKPHSFVIRAAFHVFRFIGKDGSPKTKLCLDSFYPVGDHKKLTFAPWKSDMKLKTALSKENSPEKEKFTQLVTFLQGCELSQVLQEIFPNLKSNEKLLTDIETQLDIESLFSDSLTTWPAD